ncbi:hypothetical protein D3C72_1049780 [compost metagenome]
MTTRTNAPGYMMANGHTNPTPTIRNSFVPGQVWNAAQWGNDAYTKRVEAAFELRDLGKRQEALRGLTRDILAEAPYIWLPTPYMYTAWWPWVRNYGGELRAGAVRPGPIYARMWIDQDMKKKLGF